MHEPFFSLAAGVLLLSMTTVNFALAQPAPQQLAQNPILWADVPDLSIVRVGDTFYMSSTTMHMCPGLPIMKSRDLVQWELASYAYLTLDEHNDALNLVGNASAYGAGSWASSIRYHNGQFIVSNFSSTTGRTHIYTTKDPERTPWEEKSFKPSLHDHSLFFDDDGRVYMVYGGGNIRIVELNSDLSGLKPGGVDQEIIHNASAVAGGTVGLNAEGSQLFKVNGKYYLCNITWPRGDMRTQIVHRADTITGPYEGRLMFKDRGIAQGGIIETPDGKWYAYLFQDHGAVGRIPWIIPMTWKDGWPVLGVDGKAPQTLDIPAGKLGLAGIVESDEFERKPGDMPLGLAWQWNHNPDAATWSLTARPGFLRLTTGRVDADVLHARNTLTQRTFGPASSAQTCLDTRLMKDGDSAGLLALQRKYGYVGVKVEANTKSIVMVSAQTDSPVEIARVPLTQDTVSLKIDCDFREGQDKAYFFFSLDGKTWTRIGQPLQMVYDLPHFMGYRFGLFNFATKSAGGSADFDFYRVSERIEP